MTHSETVSHADSSSTLLVRCTGVTTLGYFELGNRYNSGQHGPLFSARSDPSDLSTIDGFIRDTKMTEVGGSLYRDYDLINAIDEASLGNEYCYSEKAKEQQVPKSPGPLLLSLHALFGNGSVFHLAQDLAPLEATNSSSSAPEETLYQLLCQARPFPFRRTSEEMARRCSYYTKYYAGTLWTSEKLHHLLLLLILGDWFDIDFSGYDSGTSYLEMAMHLASQTLMEAATYPGYHFDAFRTDEVDRIWSLEGEEMIRFMVSDTAMIVLSVLVWRCRP